MWSRFSLCAILGLSLAWQFPFSSLAAQQITSESVELRGRVINGATGEPIGRALVQVSAPEQRAQFTGADGTFVFSDLPPGNYQPFARKPGFLDDSEPQGPAPTPLAAGQNEPIILKLLPEAIIFGEVKDENGVPLEGVTVRAEQWQVPNGERQLVPVREERTDDQGDFRLAELRPGRYYLSFLAANNGTWSVSRQLTSKKQEEEGYGAQFYPGVLDLESASVIEIQAGARVHIVETLTRQRLFQVAGAVRGADTANGFNLALRNPMGDVVQKRVRLDPKTGQFQISGVPRGAYLLEATAYQRHQVRLTPNGLPQLADEDRRPLTAALPLRLESDVSGLVLVLGSGSSVDVQVRNEISVDRSNGLHQVSLQLKRQGFPGSASWITVPRAPDDRRSPERFEGLAPGIYSVSGTPNGPWYIASMRCGSADLLRDDLALTTGAAPPIEVVLRDDGAQLAVNVVKNGQPVTADLLLFSPDYPRRSQFLGRGSSLSVGNLAPGRYYLIAMRGAENLEFRNPTAMEPYLAHAAEVVLGPRGSVAISAELEEREGQEQ